MTDAPAIIQNANGVWQLEGEQLWDSDLLPIILEHIKEGDTVIDAGAWIGGHTMAYAQKVGPTGKVIAFEPNPSAFDCLVQNKQQFPNVHCLNIALGDYDDRIVSFSAKRGWYDSGCVGHDAKISDVQMRTLDYYDIAPNFIKIDVEGCELKVLKGAEKTIEKHRPTIVLEINKPALERQKDHPQDIWNWLSDNRYFFKPIGDVSNPNIYNVIATPA